MFIDVGLVIQNFILHKVNTLIVELYHLSLITDLCKAIGVKWTQGEEVLQTKMVMDNNLLYSIKDQNDGPVA